jgi:nicotinate-nucleotide pyrophosphorylase (carboxylating)
MQGKKINCLQKGNLLSLKNSFYKNWFKKFILEEMKYDISKGDVTSSVLIKKNMRVNALVIAQENGIVAGVEEASYIYKNNNIKVKILKKDKDKIKNNDTILKLNGEIIDLLKVERICLNLMQRMSGIATLTNDLVNKVKKIKKDINIAGTRKIILRFLDKKAVYIGNGLTHRLNLNDAVIIKNNHLTALKKEGIKGYIKVSVDRTKKIKHIDFIEIEVRNKKEALDAAKVFKELRLKIPCLIMVDNFSPVKIKDTIKELKKQNLYKNLILEASGNINPNNIVEYAKTGVDVLSLGFLTHSVKALNIKQMVM